MSTHEGTLSSSLVDRLAIEDLIYRYSDAVTRADWVQCEATFAPDAVWESPLLDMRFATAREFLDMLAETTGFELLIQTAHSPVIQLVDDAHAKATTTVRELVRGQGVASVADNILGEAGSAANFEQIGVYFDDIKRSDGDWKFAHRLFVPLYLSMDAITGQAIAPRASLLRPE